MEVGEGVQCAIIEAVASIGPQVYRMDVPVSGAYVAPHAKAKPPEVKV